MTNRMTTVACTLLVAASAGLAACGGDDDGQKTLSRQELIAKGDALCREYNAKQAQLGEPKTTKQLADNGKKLLPVQEDIGRRFKRLRPPADQRPAFRRVIAAQETLATLNGQRYAAAVRGDAQAVKAITAEFREAYTPYVKAAKEVGFKVCATG
jgi:hypothetical protein